MGKGQTWADFKARNTKGQQTWKSVQPHYPRGKCKSKPQWDNISLLAEWLNPKQRATNAGEVVEKMGYLHTFSKNKN